jgi:20S proteasome alpha/beta subunit
LESSQAKVSSRLKFAHQKLLNQNLSIGVILAAEKKETSKLFVPLRESGKLYKVDEHIMAAVSGVVADANYLIDEGRIVAQ